VELFGFLKDSNNHNFLGGHLLVAFFVVYKRMTKSIIAMLMSVAMWCGLAAQSLKVSYHTPTYVCDTSPWRLVFYDEFNGYTDTVNSRYYPKGISPYKWNRLTGTLRAGGANPPAVIKDELVVADSGIAKSYVEHGYFGVHDGVPVTYAAGELQCTQHFGYAKFEARIFFRSFRRSHADFELQGWWSGCQYNEQTKTYTGGHHFAIDICESYGLPYYNKHSAASAHRWDDCLNYGQPLKHFPEHHEDYPHQSSPAHFGKYFRDYQDSWHVFACEWDEHFLRWTCDGDVIGLWGREMRKKGRNWVNNTECVLQGEYAIDDVFPYEGITPGDIQRFIPAIGRLVDAHADYEATDTTYHRYGPLEVDYVRIYQRQVDIDHVDLCQRKLPEVTLAADAITEVRLEGGGGPTQAGRWHWSAPQGVTVVSATATAAYLRWEPYAPSGDYILTYTDDNPLCPVLHTKVRAGHKLPINGDR
jgi:beta-glucanase (GH16 family)